MVYGGAFKERYAGIGGHIQMKFKIVLDYNVSRQRERVAVISLTSKLTEAIVKDYINNMDYTERQSWITRNKVKIVKVDLV